MLYSFKILKVIQKGIKKNAISIAEENKYPEYVMATYYRKYHIWYNQGPNECACCHWAIWNIHTNFWF